MPVVRDLVLIGGGHAHVQVIKQFGMAPLPGVRLTVISREAFSPYSGMLPGFIAGVYSEADILIDLGRLTRFANARFYHHEVTGLDLATRRVLCRDRPGVRFDVLSINSGATPETFGGEAAPLKPIAAFLPKWKQIARTFDPGGRLTIIGGGAGGLEFAMAARRSLPPQVEISVIGASWLPEQSEPARRRVCAAARAAGIELVQQRVTSVHDGVVTLASGEQRHSDCVLSATGVSAPSWVTDSGLATDAAGFVSVGKTLESTSHPGVFAAGDIASLPSPRPKSGVFAVRAGRVLNRNLRASAYGHRLARFRPQKAFLSLIGTAPGVAVASRGRWAFEGTWAWRWKEFIDRRFMRRFNELPEMATPAWGLPDALLQDLSGSAMRCGGCGAKIGADPLLRVLEQLPEQPDAEQELGIGDDAALVRTTGRVLLTIDGFRQVVDDPYRFGRIVAHHSMNDIVAMGGRVAHALALATVPVMATTLVEDDLHALLLGACAVLNAHGVPLVGGHSAEASELSLALALTGELTQKSWRKSGLRSGDVLVLTKPLGTGVLLAGYAQGRVRIDRALGALDVMDCSNVEAANVLRAHRVSAATDVSGFGLAGHLSEMLRASNVGVRVNGTAVPALAGARESIVDGLESSLHDQNASALTLFDVATSDTASVRLLADPQTSGGLLFGIAAPRAEACVSDLRVAGYPDATVIGDVVEDEWRIE